MQTDAETTRSESDGESAQQATCSATGSRNPLTNRIALLYAAVLVFLSVTMRCISFRKEGFIFHVAAEWSVWLAMAQLIGMVVIVSGRFYTLLRANGKILASGRRTSWCFQQRADSPLLYYTIFCPGGTFENSPAVHCWVEYVSMNPC